MKALLAVGSLVLACSARDAESGADTAAAGAGASGNPFAAARPVSPEGARFSGRVLERHRAGSYQYLLVDRSSPEGGESERAPLWVVTLDAVAPDAERVKVRVVRQMERFESKRLSRTFSPLAFGIVGKDGS